MTTDEIIRRLRAFGGQQWEGTWPLGEDAIATIEALTADVARLTAEVAHERLVTERACDAAEEAMAERDQHHANLKAVEGAAQSAPSGLDETQPPPEFRRHTVITTDADGCAVLVETEPPSWVGPPIGRYTLAEAHARYAAHCAPAVAAATRELRAERDRAVIDFAERIAAWQINEADDEYIGAREGGLEQSPDEWFNEQIIAMSRGERPFTYDPAPTPDTSGPQEPTDSRDPDNDADWPLPDSRMSWFLDADRWYIHVPDDIAERLETEDWHRYRDIERRRSAATKLKLAEAAAQRKRATSPTEETTDAE